MSDLSSEQRFVVGEIAVLVNCSFLHDLEGSDAIVDGPLQLRKCLDLDGVERIEFRYHISCNGKGYTATPDQLRKKRPPREDLQIVRWDECPWQPERVNG